MTSKKKPRSQRLLLAGIVALFVLLLLLRLLVFVERSGRHRFRGAGSEPTGTVAARIEAAAVPPSLIEKHCAKIRPTLCPAPAARL